MKELDGEYKPEGSMKEYERYNSGLKKEKKYKYTIPDAEIPEDFQLNNNYQTSESTRMLAKEEL